MGKVRVRTQPGAQLSESLVRSMWELRLSFKELKPDFDPDADYQRFSTFCRSCKSVFLLLDTRGGLRGFYVIKVARDSFAGREYLRITPEYAYVEKEYRGSPAMRLAYLRLLPVLFTNFGVPVYGTATITPSSYLLYTDAFQVYTHGDAHVPEWERQLLDKIGHEFGGEDWDADAKLLRSRTKLRDERPPRRFRSDEHRRAYAHYLSQNPHWEQGHQLVCVFPISLKLVLPTIQGAIKRAMSRKQSRSSAPGVADLRIPAARSASTQTSMPAQRSNAEAPVSEPS